MKKRWQLIALLGLLIAFSPMTRLALADEYDDSQAHPLRVVAYLAHPVGVLIEWVAARPFHALVSAPGLEKVFGHRPHPPLFADPQPAYDFSVPKRVAIQEPVSPKKIAPQEPIAERVTVKEVAVEKTVVKEVPKIVEVEKVVFPDIAFSFDSDRLTDLGKGKAYLVAQKLKEKSDVVVVIEGHADFIGSDEYNQRLGLRRAETVKNELLGLGIDPARLSVASLGESKPLIDQDTNWARAVNRRAEFKVTVQ